MITRRERKRKKAFNSLNASLNRNERFWYLKSSRHPHHSISSHYFSINHSAISHSTLKPRMERKCERTSTSERKNQFSLKLISNMLSAMFINESLFEKIVSDSFFAFLFLFNTHAWEYFPCLPSFYKFPCKIIGFQLFSESLADRIHHTSRKSHYVIFDSVIKRNHHVDDL